MNTDVSNKSILIGIYSFVAVVSLTTYLLASSGKGVPNSPLPPKSGQMAPGTTRELSLEDALQIAFQQHQAGQLDKAEIIYRQIIARDPNNSDAFHLLGLIAYQVGKWDSARELIAKAISINPNQADFHSNLGNAFQKLGRRDAALKEYRAALMINSGHKDALNNMGYVLQELKKHGQALACYQAVLKLNPDDTQAKNNLNNLLRERPSTVASQSCS